MDSLEYPLPVKQYLTSDPSCLGHISRQCSSSSGSVDQDSLDSDKEEAEIGKSSTIGITDELPKMRDDNFQDKEIRMTKSWHGTKTCSQRSLSFFVDLDSCDPPPKTTFDQLKSRSVSGTSFFVLLDPDTSTGKTLTREAEDKEERREESADTERVHHIRNIKQSKLFFSKVKSCLYCLSMPHSSKEEMRQKKIVADKLTRLMFEEEQRLRRGMDLSDQRQIDRILRDLPNHDISFCTDTKSEVVDKQLKQKEDTNLEKKHTDLSTIGAMHNKTLRRERTFDVETSHVDKVDRTESVIDKSVDDSIQLCKEEKRDGKMSQSGWMLQDANSMLEKDKRTGSRGR